MKQTKEQKIKDFIERYEGIDENGEYIGIRGQFIVKGDIVNDYLKTAQEMK